MSAKTVVQAPPHEHPAVSFSEARPAGERAKAPEGPPRLRIRMYRHGLGDCFLLRFARQGGGTFNVLVDCGIISVAKDARSRMEAVVNDIAQASGGRLDVVVMTHEHWDHASGFSTQQAQALFRDRVAIGEAWYGWTEDPASALGARLRQEREQKVRALNAAAAALAGRPSLAARAQGLRRMLGFFGLEPGQEHFPLAAAPIRKTRDAFEFLKNQPDIRKRYLYPDHAPVTLKDVEGVRVFVLGPPQDEALIKKSAPTKAGREVYELAAEARIADGLSAAFLRMAEGGSGDSAFSDCPFDANLRAQRSSPLLDQLRAETWDDPAQEWRRIEEDWTQAAEELALDLDNHTNNTCVALAFEFAETGEVFLFPADAQVGNWLSWQDLSWRVKSGSASLEVTGPDLLARTVFYKVGHHGSHNATLARLGLEQMSSEDLVAFIPVRVEEAQRNRWMKMPFTPLVHRLQEKTRGRLLQSDLAPPGDEALEDLSPEARTHFHNALVAEDLYYEYSFA